jgi:peptidyl-tRNA hydrolase, PTH1 family
MVRRPRLVAGLGNPGSAYADTRHNIGFRAVEALAFRSGIPFSREEPTLRWGRGRIAEIDTVVAEPLDFMNRSGPPLRELMDRLGIDVADAIVVHDDLDLEFGRIKIKAKGGHGGHKGVQSVMDAFGSGDFSRVRMGIGRPPSGKTVVDHVLDEFAPEEFRELDPFVARGRDAVEAILRKGTGESMNAFNRKLRMEAKQSWNS